MGEAERAHRTGFSSVQGLTREFRKDDYDKVLKMTEMFVWEDMPEKDPKTGTLTTAGWIPRVQKIMKIIVIYVMTVHSIQSCIRIVNNHELMFVSWYPFDMTRSPTFEIVYITQIFGLILGCSTCFAFPAMYITSICIACSQLEKLECKLLRIRQKHRASNEEADSIFEADFEIQKELNECIRHHQKIIRYLNALETAMNIPVGGILLVQLITLCTIAFSVIVNWGDLLDLIQAATLYIVMLLTVFTFCGMGTVITDKYESVREAAWSSDWVGAPVSYQRCILFIIAKSNQEFQLTAWKFVPLSNTTMMSVLFDKGEWNHGRNVNYHDAVLRTQEQ
ncbi:hypothetical protein ANN_17304 [Periplaneta americana]|uniref:Odorant receptor n=1 Tax=Periplaneta americana TaxID=6978 RepID=A0ABQ8SSK2_PERAM|nr:hypothetical protein ANN_17304 [Periplaneta americana]